MRNYSFSSNAATTFQSVNCGDEYLTGEPGVVLTDVLNALARAFESPEKVVRDLFGRIWTAEQLVKDEITGDRSLEMVTNAFDIQNHPLSPSEIEVLVGVHKFFYLAKARYEDYFSHHSGSIVFSYSNLNTGRTVVWVSSVC